MRDSCTGFWQPIPRYIERASPGQREYLTGPVIQRLNLGALQRLRVMTDGGRMMIADGLDLGTASQGDRVALGWSDASVRWLS